MSKLWSNFGVKSVMTGFVSTIAVLRVAPVNRIVSSDIMRVSSVGHLQLIPVSDGVPFEELITTQKLSQVLSGITCGYADISSLDAEGILKAYNRILDEMGAPTHVSQFSYNLLMTSRWLMLVKRTRESHQGVSINALGYVGMMLVKTETLLPKQPLDVLEMLADCAR
jgi:ATP adenylyltransferase/5',5'''-P-1,P-4-tetraphosphate phosphorylase II